MPPRRSARLSQPAAAASTSRASSTSDLTSDSEADSIALPPSSRRRSKPGSSKPKAKATPAAKSKASKKPRMLFSSEESDSDPNPISPSPKRQIPKATSSKPSAKQAAVPLSDAGSDSEPDSPPRRRSGKAKPTSIPSSDVQSDSDSISPPPKRKNPKAASANPGTKVKSKSAKDLDSDAGSDYEPDTPPPRAKSGKYKPLFTPSSDAESDFEPISPAAKRRRTRASLDYADTEQGGPAAMEVYSTLEIFQNVLARLDKATLAGMLRLEKKVTASVAAVLYKTIHVSQTNRMSRGSPRRAIYCDAVRVLDINPTPTVDFSRFWSNSYHHRRPSPFHPDLIKALPTWRKKLPHLLIILRDRPSHPAIDEAFVVHLAGDQITVDVETPHRIEMDSLPTGVIPDLPRTPDHAGLNIRHTISLTLNDGYRYTYNGQPPRYISIPNLDTWRTWSFCDPTLDSRVSSVTLDDTVIKLSAEEVISFVTHRAVRPIPLRSFSLPSVESMTMTQLRQITNLLGPSLRTLKLCSSVLVALDDWPGIVDLLDSAFPSLHTLHISSDNKKAFDSSTSPIYYSLLSSSPPSGLPGLREFRFEVSGADNKDQLALARSVCRLGASTCTYYPSEHHSIGTTKAFNDLMTKLRSSRSRYASLHTLQAKDLDLNSSSDLSGLSLEPTKGHFRRLAWTTTSTYVTDLSNQQEKLAIVVTQQQAADESYQQVLNRTTDGLEEAGGDTKAENKVLRREFEKVLKEQAKLAAACRAMKKAASEMEAKSRSLKYYARRWLDANKEVGKGAKGK